MLRVRRSLICLPIAISLIAVACTDDDDGGDTTEPSTATTVVDGDGGDDTTPPELTGEGITLGYLRPPTGLFDELGRAQADALSLAVDDIAAAGGVLGGPLEITEDQPTAQRTIDAVFSEMVGAGTQLFVGPATSDEARALLPSLAEAPAVVCGASTTAQDLTGVPDVEGRFVRTSLDDGVVAVNTVRALRDRTEEIVDRPANITIVARQDSYGIALSTAISDLLELAGDSTTIVGYDPEDVALAGVGDDVAAAGGDQVVLITAEEGPRLASLAVQAGVDPNRILGLDGLATPRFAEIAEPSDPAALDGVTVIGTTGNQAFLQRLVAVDSGQVVYGAQAYDCAISFALAVEAVGAADDPAAISAALRDVTGGGEICTTYADCLEKLQAGEDIDYDGPSGPIGFDEKGDPSGGRFTTAVVVEGQLTIVSDLRVDLDEIRALAAPHIVGLTAAVQSALRDLGFYDGPIDGKESEELTAAIAAFQTDQGLEPTGELDVDTLIALQTALGDRNSLLAASVTELQQLLTELGYYTGPIDGIYSQAVSDAVRAMQADLGVPQTGIIDAATLRAVFQAGLNTGQTTPPTTTTSPPPPPETTEPPAPTTTVPAGESVLQSLQSNPDFDGVVALIESLDPSETIYQTLTAPDAAVTFLAPPTEILEANLPPAAEVVQFLQLHTLSGKFTSEQLVTNSYQTELDEQTVDIVNDGGVITANTVTVDPVDIGGVDNAGVAHGLQGVLQLP